MTENKFTPAIEFGMELSKGEGTNKHSDMAETLNKHASAGLIMTTIPRKQRCDIIPV